MYFHEPVGIEGDSLSNLARGKVLLFREVLFIVECYNDVSVLPVG